jgi:hypothetical protein
LSVQRPARPGPGRQGEDQGLPGKFLVGFTRGLLARRQQLLEAGLPPEAARQQAAAEAIAEFAATAGERDWTVDRQRIASLASDTLGLEEEYRYQHGYAPQLARLYAVGEVLAGEQAREEVPEPWWGGKPNPPPPPRPVRAQQPPGRTAPNRQRRDAGGRR